MRLIVILLELFSKRDQSINILHEEESHLNLEYYIFALNRLGYYVFIIELTYCSSRHESIYSHLIFTQ